MIVKTKSKVSGSKRSLREQKSSTPIGDPIELLLSARGACYGEFYEHARITQNLKSAMRDSPNWGSLSPMKKEALEMIQHKVGRILNGDPNYKDSWNDIEGYSRLVSKNLAVARG